MELEKFYNDFENMFIDLLEQDKKFSRSKDEIMKILFVKFGITNKYEFINYIEQKYGAKERENIEDFFETVGFTYEVLSKWNKTIDDLNNNIDSYVRTELEKGKILEIDEYFYEKLGNQLGYSTEEMDMKLNKISNNLSKEANQKITSYIESEEIFESFNLVEEKYRTALVDNLDNNTIKKLIDKDPEELDLALNNQIDDNNNEEVYIKNLSEDIINEAISKGVYALLSYIPNEQFEKIPKSVLTEYILKTQYIPGEKKKLITKKFTLKEFIQNFEYYVEFSQYSKYYEEIDRETAEFIINNKPDFLDYENIYNIIINNKEYVKMLIDAQKCSYIKDFSEAILDDELFEYIVKQSPNFASNILYGINPKKKYKIFESKKNTLKVLNYLDFYYKIEETLLKQIPKENLQDAILFLQLNGMGEPQNEEYKQFYKDNLTIEDIKHAIEIGYKYCFATKLTSEEEIKLFIDNGQVNAFDTVLTRNTLNDVSVDLYKNAIDKGYKLGNECNLVYAKLEDDKMNEIIKYCLENGRQDFILQNLVETITIYIGSLSNIDNTVRICTSLNKIKGDMSFRELLEKYNMLDDFLNIMIFKHQTTKVSYQAKTPIYTNDGYDERIEKIDFTDIIKEKYKNYDIIKKYLESPIRWTKRIDINENTIEQYFDELGPTKKYFDYFLFNDSFGDLSGQTNLYKLRYSSNPEILHYINIKKLCPLDFVNNYDDLKTFFDAEGPTEKCYELIFNKKIYPLLATLNEQNYTQKKYKEKPAIIEYSNFIQKYNLCFDFIKFEDIEKYFDENGYKKELVDYLSQNKEETKDLLYNNIAHNDNLINNIDKNFINIFRNYIEETLLSNKDNASQMYDYLVEKLGPKLLFNLENKQIQKLIEYDINDLDKLFNLFDRKTTKVPDERLYSSFVQSLLTYKFKTYYPHIVNIFTNFNSAIQSIPIEKLQHIIDNNVYDSSIGNYAFDIAKTLHLNKTEGKEFLNAIKECRMLNEQPLRKICRKYLEESQKQFFAQNEKLVLSELELPSEFDKKDAYEKLFNYYQNNVNYSKFNFMRNEMLQKINYENQTGFIEQINMSKKEFDTILNLSIEQFDLINYAIKNKTKPDASVTQEFKLYKKFLSQYVKYNIENNNIDNDLLGILNVEQKPIIPLEKNNMISILNDLDLEIFFNKTANDEKILNNLQSLCSKYYLGRLPEKMGEGIERIYDIELQGGINNLGTFINKYYQFLLRKQKLLKLDNQNVNLEDIKFTFLETINLISIANSTTDELKRLIGNSEYYDFVSNKGPNSSHASRKDREEKMGLIVDYLYSVDSITVPSGDIIVESNNKKINFIVGNRTNPANICHGERTGACMRVGGVGESLFIKCLTDKNWFHIRIEDPETHEYVSRVSCFRNGNSVYCNQLRNVPSGSKYTNNDLQEFITEYAKKLIEQTKNSEFPIENVFINPYYAMEGYQKNNGKKYCLGYDIQKEYNINDVHNLCINPGSNVYTDVHSNAYLLATTEEGTKTSQGYAPIKNGPENTEIYPATRDKIYGLNFDETEIPKHRFVTKDQDTILEKINRVHCMKQKLLGIDYKYGISEIDNEFTIVDGYASSDWYAYIDSNYNIHADFISKIKEKDYTQSSEAQSEMQHYVEELERKYNLEVKHAI